MFWWGGVKGLLGFLGLIPQFNCQLQELLMNHSVSVVSFIYLKSHLKIFEHIFQMPHFKEIVCLYIFEC